MNEDEKELLKNLDLLMNMDLVQSEKDWDLVQNLDDLEASESTEKNASKAEELKLDEEE